MSAVLPRRGLVWLLGALLLAIGPHVTLVPAWALLAVGICIGWRFRVYQGRWSFPSRLAKFALVLMAFAAVGLQFRTLNGLPPAISLLVIAGGLKSMELRNRRDALVVGFVAWFLIASQLLIEQGIPYALYALGAAAVVAAALVALHQGEPREGFPHPLRLAFVMLGQALPLMLVLFVVFPRIAPLWALPQNTAAAKTGPGDTMSPGDVAQLSGSNALAFRVTFDGPIPAQRELYWRGLVFSDFDGREWRQSAWARIEQDSAARRGTPSPARRPSWIAGGEPISYEVILEPSNRQWAYAVGLPLWQDQELRLGSDFRLISALPVSQRMRYRVRADLAATLEPELRPLRRRAELELPQGYNPRAVAMAREWRAGAGSDSAFIERVLGWFNEEEFVYTLRPPLLGRDTVDEFLFGERRGFCEHYASAFVVLLRAAGIPARVVVGYQGGQRNPFEDYLLVHQFDAHAWAEAWLPGRGWVRFDPTAAVSPARIESSLGDVLGEEFLADSPLALQRYRGVAALGWILMRWDLATYHWARLVLQYDSDRQMRVLERILGALDPVRLAIGLLGSGAVVLLAVAVALFGWPRRRHADPATRAWLGACAALERIGLPRLPGEGPLAYARRIATVRPDLGPGFVALSEQFALLGYGTPDAGQRAALLARLRSGARSFRPRVAGV